MWKNNNLLFIAGFIILLVTEATSLKCFECTMSEEDSCSDPSNCQMIDCAKSIFTVKIDPRNDGQPSEYSCLSTVERNGTSTYCTRRCAFKSETSLCNDRYESCSFCQGDYCNAASKMNGNSLFSIFSLILCCLYLMDGEIVIT